MRKKRNFGSNRALSVCVDTRIDAGEQSIMTAQEDFWHRLQDVDAGMLGLLSGSARLPVTPRLRETFDGHIWVLETEDQMLSQALIMSSRPAHFVTADGVSGLYANLTGHLDVIEDPQIIEELWMPQMQRSHPSFFDRPLQLLRFTPDAGTVWYSSTKGMTYLCAFGTDVSDSTPISLHQR